MSTKVTPPKHLSRASKAWWRKIMEEYVLEGHHVRLLTLAAEAWDRATQAREILEVEGVTYLDRFGAPRKHPAVSIEENARTSFARLIRELDLDGGGSTGVPAPDKGGGRPDGPPKASGQETDASAGGGRASLHPSGRLPRDVAGPRT